MWQIKNRMSDKEPCLEGACFYEQWTDSTSANFIYAFQCALFGDPLLCRDGWCNWELIGLHFDHGRVGYAFQCAIDEAATRPATELVASHANRLRCALDKANDWECRVEYDIEFGCCCDQGERVLRIVLELRSENSESACRQRLANALTELGLGLGKRIRSDGAPSVCEDWWQHE